MKLVPPSSPLRPVRVAVVLWQAEFWAPRIRFQPRTPGGRLMPDRFHSRPRPTGDLAPDALLRN